MSTSPSLVALTALALLVDFACASPVPRPTATVPPNLLPRQIMGIPYFTFSSSSTDPTPTAATASSSSSPSSGSDNPWKSYSGMSDALPAVVGGIVAIILVAAIALRFFYMYKNYPPSFRAFFVPPKGLHSDLLRLHLEPATPRPPRGPPPSYNPRQLLHFRRGAAEVGSTIGPGGVRTGTRDEDDRFDGEGEGAMEEKDRLPMYSVDVELPGYIGSPTTRIEASSAEEEVLPTPAEYEAALRAARAHVEASVAPLELRQQASTPVVDTSREASGSSSEPCSCSATLVDEEGTIAKKDDGDDEAVKDVEDAVEGSSHV